MKTLKPEFHAYDSEYDEEYPGHRRYAVAYTPLWQWIRFNLKWTTYEDAMGSNAICDAYVMAAPKDDLKNRVWRVYNLLCAIPHGQSTKIGIRIIERSATAILVPFLDSYRVKAFDIGFPEEWDWANVRHEAEIMQLSNPGWLEKTTKNLLRRRSNRSHPKPELRHYLRICLDAMGIYEPLEQRKSE